MTRRRRRRLRLARSGSGLPRWLVPTSALNARRARGGSRTVRLVPRRSAEEIYGGSALGMSLAGLRVPVLTRRLEGTCGGSASWTRFEVPSKASFSWLRKTQNSRQTCNFPDRTEVPSKHIHVGENTALRSSVALASDSDSFMQELSRFGKGEVHGEGGSVIPPEVGGRREAFWGLSSREFGGNKQTRGFNGIEFNCFLEGATVRRQPSFMCGMQKWALRLAQSLEGPPRKRTEGCCLRVSQCHNATARALDILPCGRPLGWLLGEWFAARVYIWPRVSQTSPSQDELKRRGERYSPPGLSKGPPSHRLET